MPGYVILLPGDESRWEKASPEERTATYDVHRRFAALLAERGHTLTGGAELAHSRTARVVHGGDPVSVTEGPYTETAEQLSGFYTVATDDLDDLLDAVGVLAGTEGVVEVRPVVAIEGDDSGR